MPTPVIAAPSAPPVTTAQRPGDGFTRRPLAASLAALLVVAQLAACGPQRPSRAPAVVTTPISLVERYERVALRDDDGLSIARILRWEGPIHWALDADPATARRWRPVLAAHMAELRALTGLEIVEWDLYEANFVVLIRPPRVLPGLAEIGVPPSALRHMARSNCGAWGTTSPWALMYIRETEHPTIIGNCLLQETTQALGLPGDLDERVDTIFASWATRQDMSEADRQIVQLHYSHEIRAGMPGAEAMAVVRRATTGL